MGDRVAVLKDGILQQVAPPRELYNFPVNEFVAGFIGSPAMNLFPTDGMTLGVRPEHMLVLSPGAEAPAGWQVVAGTVELIEELGAESYVYATCQGTRLVARSRENESFARDMAVRLAYDPAAAHRFDPQSGLRISGV